MCDTTLRYFENNVVDRVCGKTIHTIKFNRYNGLYMVYNYESLFSLLNDTNSYIQFHVCTPENGEYISCWGGKSITLNRQQFKIKRLF